MDPRDMAGFITRSTTLLHTKYKSSEPCGFRDSFLSHLLIAGCDIGVQISIRPSVHPSIRLSTFMSKVDIYVKVFVFSAFMIAVTVKNCIVIVLDIPFKYAP